MRFSRNVTHVVVIGDAWTLGLSKKFMATEAFKRLTNPNKFFRLIGNGLDWNYANVPNAEFSKAIYLPQPIYRYWSLFPRNHLEKSLGHAQILGWTQFYDAVNTLKPYIDDPSAFWNLASTMLMKGFIGRAYPEHLRLTEKDDHPRIMQDLVEDPSDAHDHYYVREEILDEIVRA